MKILVIEDQDAIRNMIEALVKARGYEVTAAASGAKGLDLAATQLPDVVLLDLTMPGLYDGFDVCQRLREDPRTRAVPIVVISALDDEASKARVMAAGATAFFNKPFSPIKLLKELEHLGGGAKK